MLTVQQVSFIEQVSWAASFGMTNGALCGLIVGSLVHTLRTRKLGDLAVGPVYGAVPGAASGAIASIIIAATAALLCRPDSWDGYHVPEWFFAVSFTGPLLVAAMGALLAVPTLRTMPSRKSSFILKLIGLTVIGGLIGATANVHSGFTGYFIRGSNESPIRWAVRGFAFGSVAVLCWIVVVDLMRWRDLLCRESVQTSSGWRDRVHEMLRKLVWISGAVFVSAWLTTFALLWSILDAGPHTRVRANYILPTSPSVVVEYQSEAGQGIRQVIRFRGGLALFHEFVEPTDRDSSRRSTAVRTWSHSNSEVTEWLCGDDLIVRIRQTGYEVYLRFLIPALTGVVALAAFDLLNRKNSLEQTAANQPALAQSDTPCPSASSS